MVSGYLRQHGPIDFDRTRRHLVPALQTRHLSGVLFQLGFDLCLLYYHWVNGFHVFGEGARIHFIDAILLCAITIIIGNFGRESARSSLAIVVISTSLPYIDCIEELV